MFTRAGFGSNNWAIAPSRSATGHALIASDPAPLAQRAVRVLAGLDPGQGPARAATPRPTSTWRGLAFPGIPGIILGHNEHIAWGATVAGYDVSDAYAETLTPDGKGVMFNGKTVRAPDDRRGDQAPERAAHHLHRAGRAPPRARSSPTSSTTGSSRRIPTKGAISIRWTGIAADERDPGRLRPAPRHRRRRRPRRRSNDFGVGGQNWMIGDTSGAHPLDVARRSSPRAIGARSSGTRRPTRAALPCFVLPGDGTAEWTGFLPDDLVPWEKDPAAGYMSTANNDPIGNTLDNDPSNDTLPDGTPMYLACTYDIGFREGKIHKRIEAHTAPLATADLSAIQGDEQSSMGTGLTPALVDRRWRTRRPRSTTPGTHPDLTAVVSDPAYDPAQIKTIHDCSSPGAPPATPPPPASIPTTTSRCRRAAPARPRSSPRRRR